MKGTTCPSVLGFPEWTFAGGKVPQLEHAWCSNKEGTTNNKHSAAPDTRLVRWCSRAYCVLACSLSRGLSRAAGYNTEITFKLTTRVGLDATCYSNPDDDTCRVGCNREMTLKLS